MKCRKEDETTMKSLKYIMLAALFLFVFSVVGAEAAPSRYEGIVMDDAVVAQIDKDTLRYEKDPYRNEKLLSVWIKTPSDFGSDFDFSLNHYLFRLNNRDMLLLDTAQYNGAGQIISKITNPYNPTSWTMIMPETVQEKCYVLALKYARDNNAQLQQDYDERTVTQKNTTVPLLGDIFNILSNN